MPDTKSITPAEFRTAEDTCQRELLALLSRHRAALGDLGVIHALIETVGSLCVATLTAAGPSDERERARRRVHEWIAHAQTFVATSHGDLDVIAALIEMLKSQIAALHAFVATANARPH